MQLQKINYRGHPKRKEPWIHKHPPPVLGGDNEGFVGKQRLLVPPAQPPPQTEIQKLKSQRLSGFWSRHSNNRRKQANVWKHPPPFKKT